MDDIVTRLGRTKFMQAADVERLCGEAANDIELLCQGIWAASRVLGMNTDDDIVPLALTATDFANLIMQETLRSTSESQQEVERLQAENDELAVQMEDCERDFHTLKQMFDTMRESRNGWRKIAEGSP